MAKNGKTFTIFYVKDNFTAKAYKTAQPAITHASIDSSQ